MTIKKAPPENDTDLQKLLDNLREVQCHLHGLIEIGDTYAVDELTTIFHALKKYSGEQNAIAQELEEYLAEHAVELLRGKPKMQQHDVTGLKRG